MDASRQLQTTLGWPPGRAAAVLRYLADFAGRCGYGSDYTALSGARDDAERAADAWDAMRRDGRWSPKHAVRVRGWLAAALRVVASPALAAVIHPTASVVDDGTNVRYLAARSHESSFTLHDCLPLRVRRLGVHHADYRLLARLCDECSAHLRSVSRSHLQRMCGVLDALLHGWSNMPDSGERWQWLASRAPHQWMRRYAEVMGQRRTTTITFDHFKRHMRLLAIVHGKVFHPEAKASYGGEKSWTPSPSYMRPCLRPR